MSHDSPQDNAEQVALQADLPTHSQYLLEEKLVLLAGSKKVGRGVCGFHPPAVRAG